MEFLKVVKHRTFLNEAIYVGLNVGLAISLMLIIKITGSLLPAFLLVLLSMWRVFAVRLRFWFANIQANLVSAIVSIGYVVFLYVANTSNIDESRILIIQVILTILYTAWLLLLKPRSKRLFMAMQAGTALFVGVTAIYIMSFGWIASPVVLLMWLVGYATARHILSSYDDESHALFLSLVWGLVMAEIGWIAYHWTTAYKIPIIANIFLPQVSIIAICLGFLVYKSYNSYYHHQKIRFNDIVLPLIFTVSIISLLILAFNGVSSAI